MRLTNIHRLTFFSRPREELLIQGHPQTVGYRFWQTLSQCNAVFGFEPNGLNFYIALTQERIDAWILNGKTDPETLNISHRTQFFEPVVQELKTGALQEATIILSLEPKQSISDAHPNPYDTVREMDTKGYLQALARQIHSYQVQCAPKTLRVVIRYASEMNAKETVYSSHYVTSPQHFIDTFRLVYQAFNGVSPQFIMAFSPAIRTDLTVSDMMSYFPGKDVVELVAGSWYCGKEQNLATAQSRYLAYLKAMQLKMNGSTSTPLICAIDEIGGCDGATSLWKKGQPLPTTPTGQAITPGGDLEVGKYHERVLPGMLAYLGSLSPQFQFDYVTLFLTGKWDTCRNVTDFLTIAPL